MSENLRDEIVAILHTIYDPEIPVNIYELGLIYKLEISEDGKVIIEMTLTAPGCPVAGDIVQEVQEKVGGMSEVSDVHVQLTFDPPWNMEMMTEEARLELGFL